jgi:hypothetical protein
MRCIGCGDRLSRTNLGVAGVGVVLCAPCIRGFADVLNGNFPEPRGATLQWGDALVDVSALDGFSDTVLRFELGVVRDLAAPFVAFIEAAQRKLDGDPKWRNVEFPGRHQHRDVVVLPDGTPVRAASLPRGGSDQLDAPDFGVYLDRAWKPTWSHVFIEWPDFGLPSDRNTFLQVVDDVLARARNGAIVEIGCLGGHGRTGTFLAVLAVRAGEPSSSSVSWVRARYCHEAIETVEQEAFIESF